MSKLLFFFVAYHPELTTDPNKENMHIFFVTTCRSNPCCGSTLQSKNFLTCQKSDELYFLVYSI